MKNKKNPYFFALITFLLLLSSCSTMKFGKSVLETLYTEDEGVPERIREFDLSYNYKVMGVKVSGKSIIEDLFILDEQTMFIVISFPRVGILKTTDFGKTFKSSFFSNRYLEKVYNYQKEAEEDEVERESEERQVKPALPRQFVYSKSNKKRVAISVGPYLYLSEDGGESWTQQSVFMDIENAHIESIVVSESDELFLFTNNRMAYSTDWGRKWEKRAVKLDTISSFKMEFVSAFYKDKTLYCSYRHRDEPNALLSRLSYERLYLERSSGAKSGLFISTDQGRSWQRGGLNIPVVLWDEGERIYGSPVYELTFYNQTFSPGFMESPLYREGVLNSNSLEAEELIKLLQESELSYLELLPLAGGRLFSFYDKNVKNLEIVENKEYNCNYRGNKVLAANSFVLRGSLIDDGKGSFNFHYNYNPYRLFRVWMGLKSSPALLYTVTDADKYYRIAPDRLFLKHFFKYVILERARINSINPFLRKAADVEFFNAELDPSKGFPVQVEQLEESGWTLFEDSSHINRIINPLGNKRSEFHWYKNIDKKKSYKLQLTFGKEDGIDFMVYPYKLLYNEGALLMINNYYSLEKSYMDLYIMEIAR